MPKAPDQTEKALLAALKEHRGERLTAREQSALEKYRRKQASELLDDLLTKVPKKLYCQLSGRQTKILHDQADTHGLPLRGSTIDLFDVISAFHDILAKHAKTIASDGDVELKRAKLKGEIEVLERRAKILDGEISQQRARFIERSELRRRLGWLSTKLADLGERVGKFGGPETQRAINEFLEELASEIESGTLSVGGD